jgi:MoaA/NifB/PqqE/SkfB family radical SAM enzyme
MKNEILVKLSRFSHITICNPTRVSVTLSYRCNARCRMCDSWKKDPKGELNFRGWVEFFRDLRAWLGPFYVNLSGGEPFLAEGFFDLLKFFRESDIKAKISTNGLCMTKMGCEAVLERGLDFVSFSIDSRFAEIHDSLRGREGLLNTAVEGIRYLKKSSDKVVIGITSIINSYNFSDLTNYAKWAVDLGIDRLSFQPIHNNFFQAEQKCSIRENPLYQISDLYVLEREINGLIALKARGYPIWNTVDELSLIKNYFYNPQEAQNRSACEVGFYTLQVDPYGNARLCGNWDYPIGNIRFSHIKDMWLSATAETHRKKMLQCRAICLLSCNRKYSFRDKIKIARLLFNNNG